VLGAVLGAVVGAGVVGAVVGAVLGAVVGAVLGAVLGAVVGAVVGAGVEELQLTNEPATYNILLFGFGELIEATVTLVTLESLVIGDGKSTYVTPSAEDVAENEVIKLPPLYAFNVI
jgi:tetrahydromethanopterin S-methyltransferase subunit C